MVHLCNPKYSKAKIGKITFQGLSAQKLVRLHLNNKKAGHSGTHLSSQLYERLKKKITVQGQLIQKLGELTHKITKVKVIAKQAQSPSSNPSTTKKKGRDTIETLIHRCPLQYYSQ
jgi:ATP phosphoribosyltransferase